MCEWVSEGGERVGGPDGWVDGVVKVQMEALIDWRDIKLEIGAEPLVRKQEMQQLTHFNSASILEWHLQNQSDHCHLSKDCRLF